MGFKVILIYSIILLLFSLTLPAQQNDLSRIKLDFLYKNKCDEIIDLISNRFGIELPDLILGGNHSTGSLVNKKYISRKLGSTYMHYYIFPEDKC
ncbi:hypothetical protein MNBD_IGNAVI01-1488 [hydrothermal vent metagenome]|uniref:Uncharacterized protein n=1 Tax=hydrothermal vent metagenome TaxID=652676 RepID=A0A3B1CBI9_9ZZZZ